jgi:hypothetical protein
MTDHDLLLTNALDELVPSFESLPGDWQDALRRARVRTRSRARRRLLVVAAAAAFAVGVLATTSLGQDVLNRTLDRLGSWVGSAPGEPASPEQQSAFDAANAESYAHFAPGTKVGRLLSTTFAGERYELFGFRDGGSLCLRLIGAKSDGRPPAACVPQRELIDLGQPAAVVSAGDVFTRGSEALATAVYGVAADAVEQVEIATASGERHEAQLGNNAFLYLATGNRSHPETDATGVPVRAIVASQDGVTATVPIETGVRLPPTTAPAELPGPSAVERTLDGSRVSWLEHGDPRGDPYTWTGGAMRTLKTSRVVQPDPTSSFRMAVASGTSTDGYERYCFVWLWPLVKGTGGYGCMLAEVTGGLPMVGTGEGADQFPLMTGLAADEVASLELFFPNGARENVPLTDNVYAFQAPVAVPTKLVAYDANHRVVGIYML